MPSYRLGILDCDELSEAVRDDYVCYGTMFRDLLAPWSGGINFVRYSIVDHEFPSSAGDCDAYLITGSKTGVYDDVPWLPRLREFINSAYDLGERLIGICFGHQLIADTLGGKAEKSSKGWGIGNYTVSKNTTDTFLTSMPENLRLLYSHQDQVTKLPTGAVDLYGNEFCPHAAYILPGKVLAFQGHPEFTRDYCRRLMMTRRDRYPPECYDRAMASLDDPLDDQLVACLIIDFIKGAKQT